MSEKIIERWYMEVNPVEDIIEDEFFTLPELIAKEYPDLREKIAKLLYNRISLGSIFDDDWVNEKEWVKEDFRKQADAILNIFKEGNRNELE